MHIAILFEFPTLQGGEHSLLAMVREFRLQNRMLEITAFAPPTGPLAEQLHQHGIHVEPWSIRDAHGQRLEERELQRDLIARLNRLKLDIVHANSLTTGRLLGRIAGELKVPTTAHLRDIMGLSGAAIADLNRHRKLIAVSAATRTFHREQGIDGEICEVIHNGIDLTEFAQRPRTGRLHAEFQIPREARLIATIGQICLRKGWDTLADAVAVWPKLDPESHLLLIGTRHSQKAESRRYEEGIREEFRVSGWEPRVHWLGERSDVPSLMNELDLLVHPARQEPLGRVLLEAMAAGVPIVATDVGGTAELIEPEISGRLVRPDDPQQLADAMSSVLNNSELAARFRHAGRQRAEQRFDIAVAAARVWELWRQLV